MMLFPVILVLCIQAYLVQNAFSQYIRPHAGLSPATISSAPMTSDVALDILSAPFVASVTTPLTDPFLVPSAADAFVAYGGAIIGEAAITGEIPTAGATALIGQVPILGSVEFGGVIPAAGTISITGTCACGCGGTLIY